MQRRRKSTTNKSSLISDIALAYFVAFPATIMILFAYFAIARHGIFTIDMTHYGEYELEIAMLLAWFGIGVISFVQNILRPARKQIKL